MSNPEDTIHQIPARRTFLLGSLALAISATSLQAVASSKGHHHHHHHHHHGSPKHTGVIDAAVDCIKTAKLCRDHCIELVKQGDTSISECLDVVTDTIAICESLVQLTVSNSRHLPAFAKVCIEVCQDCEEECRLHEDKHSECKACMLSCKACIKELRAVAV